jgi:hypothetical protein
MKRESLNQVIIINVIVLLETYTMTKDQYVGIYPKLMDYEVMAGDFNHLAHEWIQDIYECAEVGLPHVRKLGKWPNYVSDESILSRIPKEKYSTAPGFDAGVAACMGYIPPSKAALACKLHASYSEEAIDQLRDETKAIFGNSEACWWLAACSLCEEASEVTQLGFIQQIIGMQRVYFSEQVRLQAATREYSKMVKGLDYQSIFNRDDFVYAKDGFLIPIVYEDGKAQGAYLTGYPVVVTEVSINELYFVSTYKKVGLGLENFNWSNKKDKKGRDRSGPVHGSKQFVKCADFGELNRALEIVVEHQLNNASTTYS